MSKYYATISEAHGLIVMVAQIWLLFHKKFMNCLLKH